MAKRNQLIYTKAQLVCVFVSLLYLKNRIKIPSVRGDENIAVDKFKIVQIDEIYSRI